MNMKYDFKVKADAQGKFFLAEIRENLNRNKCYLRVRANGNRAEHAIADGLHAREYDQDLPMRYAQEYRIYIINKKTPTDMVRHRKYKITDPEKSWPELEKQEDEF